MKKLLQRITHFLESSSLYFGEMEEKKRRTTLLNSMPGHGISLIRHIAPARGSLDIHRVCMHILLS